ncbi:MAG: branched-chain amino acid ABC transporter permease [Rhodobacteraceae bacterium]|nr:branched-chain amino acid ABC transporter permease [Paracoccaceae bacterium]
MHEPILNRVVLLLLFCVPVGAYFIGETYTVTLATRTVILALAAVGLNVALGLGGMVSFGHAAFFGLGGYTAGVLASHSFNSQPLFEWPIVVHGTNFMPLIWFIVIIVGGSAAYIIGRLSLRTTGVYFIMITLAFAQMLYYFAISWPTYGGEDGLPLYVRNDFPGLNTQNSLHFFLICFTILVICLLFFWFLQRSSFGLALMATRENSQRVESLGIETRKLKIIAFVLSGIITGIAGALYADLNRFVSPQMYSWHLSGEIIIFVILGGVGRLIGPVVGTVLYVLIDYYIGGFTTYWKVFLGLLLIGVVLYSKQGLVGMLIARRE